MTVDWLLVVSELLGAVVGLKLLKGRVNIIPTSRRRLLPLPDSVGRISAAKAVAETHLTH